MYDDLSFQIVTTAYGLTESTGTATLCTPADPLEAIAETCGRPIPGVEVRILSETTDGGVQQAGEILVRGYNVTKGYWNDPEATSEAIDVDGWLHTGDVGYFDDHGFLRMVDRIKDMFIVGGFNAYPAEIELVLLEHPSITAVAVVGVADERLGEVGFAFVVVEDGSDATPSELITWSKARLANYKVPRHIRVVPALPISPSGKVHKPTLRHEAAAMLSPGP